MLNITFPTLLMNYIWFIWNGICGLKTLELTHTKSQNKEKVPVSVFRNVRTHISQKKGDAIFYMYFDKVFSYTLIVCLSLHNKPSGNWHSDPSLLHS